MSTKDIESLELWISKFLRVGVIFSGILMATGWIMTFKWSGNPFYFFDFYDPIPFKDLLGFYIMRENWGVLTSIAGLIVLISLPVLRVLLTCFLFLKQKEYILALIAFIVFTGLMVSLFLGLVIS